MEEEDGDRQEEEEEVESGEANQRECAMDFHADGCDESAQDLSHEVCVYHHKLWNKDACRLSACTPGVR